MIIAILATNFAGNKGAAAMLQNTRGRFFTLGLKSGEYQLASQTCSKTTTASQRKSRLGYLTLITSLVRVVFIQTLDYTSKSPNVEEEFILDEKDKFLDYEGRELLMTVAEKWMERGRKEAMEKAEKDLEKAEKDLEKAEKALEQAEKDRIAAIEAERTRYVFTQSQSARKAFMKGFDVETVADLIDLPLDILLSIKNETSTPSTQ